MEAVVLRPPSPPDAPHGGGDSGGNGCPWAPRHLPGVFSTFRWRDWFRRRYVIRCWECDFHIGPFETWAMAHSEKQDLEAL
jgi:hypothetical protein